MQTIKKIGWSIIGLCIATIVATQVLSQLGFVEYLDLPFRILRFICVSFLLVYINTLTKALKHAYHTFFFNLLSIDGSNYVPSDRYDKLIKFFLVIVWLYLLVSIVMSFLV